VLQVIDEALLADALHVVEDPGRDRATQRDVDVAGRGHQSRNQTRIVAEQDEQAKRRDERQVAAAVRPDPFLEQLDDRHHAVFEQDLELAGMLDAEPRAHDHAHDRDCNHDQQRHHEIVRNDLVPLEMKAQGLERRLDQRPEQGVHKLHYPEGMFEHSSFIF
jgi:hypothetical protein